VAFHPRRASSRSSRAGLMRTLIPVDADYRGGLHGLGPPSSRRAYSSDAR
jgi:hypothetical protein